jgi:hypothetical protein
MAGGVKLKIQIFVVDKDTEDDPQSAGPQSGGQHW